MNLALAERFWSKVKKTKHCWVWIGALDTKGRARIAYKWKNQAAARVSWFLSVGKWSVLSILHHCDNVACVRPDHLYEGTQKQNMEDCVRRGRIARGLRTGRYTHPEAWDAKHRNMRGEGNSAAKLTKHAVRSIRFLLECGYLSRKEVANRFHVSKPLIDKIAQRKIWS